MSTAPRPTPTRPDSIAIDARFRLDGRVVVITGASSGLGARWTPVLAAAGASVVLFARREAELQEVAASTPGSVAVAGDMTSSPDRNRLVETAVATFGRIDVLVNNAGDAASDPALATSVDQFREMLEIDLVAMFALTQVVARVMIDNGGGSIINVASLAAERAVDRYPLAAYSAAKAGVVALTRTLASEWGRHGVRVNAISPAFFPTRLSGYLEDPDQVSWIRQRTALRRTPRLDELDGSVMFLASDASTYITGQHLVVDGGWTVY